jgi:hypothetical protein
VKEGSDPQPNEGKKEGEGRKEGRREKEPAVEANVRHNERQFCRVTLHSFSYLIKAERD